MRILVDVNFPLEPFNTLVRNGTVGQKIQQILADLKPEAVYFSERNGKRGGIFIVDVSEPSQVPAIAEPFFLTFDASVEFRVAMTPEDPRGPGSRRLGGPGRKVRIIGELSPFPPRLGGYLKCHCEESQRRSNLSGLRLLRSQ